MTPIISPWFFYLLQIVDGLSVSFVIIASAIAVYGAIRWFLIFDEEEGDTDSPFYKEGAKQGKKLLIVMIVFWFLSILVPTKTTCLEMLVAQNVTYERVEVVGQTVEDIYNDIINLFPQEKEESTSN